MSLAVESQDEHLPFSEISSPLFQAILASSMLWGTPVGSCLVLGLISDFLGFFFFPVNTCHNFWFNKIHYFYLSTYCVLWAPQDIEPRLAALLWEPLGMYCPSRVTLAGDLSKRLQFHTRSVGMKAIPDIWHPLFFLRCLNSSSLLICLSCTENSRISQQKTN